jgi:hypothetical protein
MRPRPLDTRIYRVALWLYPPEFRREFSSEMARVFEDARDETAMAAAGEGLWPFRARMGADLAAAIVRQWLRTGWPVIAAISVAVPFIAAAALAALPRLAAFAPGQETADQDALALAMLVQMVLVVLLIIVATLFFTHWFARPFPHRRRR